MGLISTEVNIRIRPRMVKHYKSLGYEMPRKDNGKIDFSQYITVKVKDLTPWSNVELDIECDDCKKPLKRKYQDYVLTNYDGKTYCNSCNKKGSKNPNWNPNLTDEDREIKRHYPEYVDFVKNVMTRDNYTCQCCGKKSNSDMEVHHLYGYSAFPEYRLDQTQAITLCEKCHNAFHNWHYINFGYHNKGNCTREQFEKWFGKAVVLVKNDIEISSTRKPYCFENDTVYDGVTSVERLLHIDKSKIYDICNNKKGCRSANGYHFIWHDIYLKMNEEEIKEYYNNLLVWDNCTKVICITTGKVFDSLKEAGEFYNIKHYCDISTCCVGNRKSCGKLSDGTKLQWMYYDDYLEKINNGEEIVLIDERIICITTNEIFNSLKHVSDTYKNIEKSNISACCKGKVKSAGKTTDGLPMRWMYYKDYLKLKKDK